MKRLQAKNLAGNRQHLYLIHGFAGSPENWTPLIRELAGRVPITTYTLPAHGERNKDKGPFSIGRCARELNRLITRDGALNPILVSHSMGARIVMETFAEQLKEVSSIILVDGSNCPIDPATARANFQSLIDDRGFAAAMLETMEGFLLEGIRADLCQQLLRGSQCLSQAAALDFTESMAKWDSDSFRKCIDAIELPVTVLQSSSLSEDEDMTRHYIEQIPDSAWTKAWDLKANASIERISDCGHYAMIEKPDVIANAILKVLRESDNDK